VRTSRAPCRCAPTPGAASSPKLKPPFACRLCLTRPRRTQPGGTFLACSAPLSGTTLSVLQAAGAYVSPFGYPSSTSFASNKVATMCGLTTLPTGSGGNPIALTMNGQVIDAVRARLGCALHA